MKIKLILFLTLFVANYLLADEPKEIIIATTTSTENSGLLDYLLPFFEKKHLIKVKIIATGTGNALKLAEKGDVDIVIVHAPKKEKQFVKNGFGVERKNLMYNYFLIVGPKNDPANIKYSDNLLSVLTKIKTTKAPFISRGDNSGTHFKELNIWQQLNIEPNGSWYKEVGQGMGRTLQIANELNAYTLVDQGTWFKLKDKLQLELLYYSDPIMFNVYSVILVNPIKYPDIKLGLAKTFLDWITSDETKENINNYRINGQQLFFAKKIGLTNSSVLLSR